MYILNKGSAASRAKSVTELDLAAFVDLIEKTDYLARAAKRGVSAGPALVALLENFKSPDAVAAENMIGKFGECDIALG